MLLRKDEHDRVAARNAATKMPTNTKTRNALESHRDEKALEPVAARCRLEFENWTLVLARRAENGSYLLTRVSTPPFLPSTAE